MSSSEAVDRLLGLAVTEDAIVRAPSEVNVVLTSAAADAGGSKWPPLLNCGLSSLKVLARIRVKALVLRAASALAKYFVNRPLN
jgi:hypothetical protein